MPSRCRSPAASAPRSTRRGRASTISAPVRFSRPLVGLARTAQAVETVFIPRTTAARCASPRRPAARSTAASARPGSRASTATSPPPRSSASCGSPSASCARHAPAPQPTPQPGRTAITNVVMMGMGEPLRELPQRGAGAAHAARRHRLRPVAPARHAVHLGPRAADRQALRDDATWRWRCRCTRPNDALRDELVPINRSIRSPSCSTACWRYLDEQHGRSVITFEYVHARRRQRHADAGARSSLQLLQRHAVQGQPDSVQSVPGHALPALAATRAIQRFRDELARRRRARRPSAGRAATTSTPPAASSPAASSIAPRYGSATRSSASRFNHEYTNRSLTWLSGGTVCRSRAAGGLRDECCAGQTQQGRRVLQRPAWPRLPEPGRPAAGEGQARSRGEAEPRQRRRAQRARLSVRASERSGPGRQRVPHRAAHRAARSANHQQLRRLPVPDRPHRRGCEALPGSGAQRALPDTVGRATPTPACACARPSATTRRAPTSSAHCRSVPISPKPTYQLANLEFDARRAGAGAPAHRRLPRQPSRRRRTCCCSGCAWLVPRATKWPPSEVRAPAAARLPDSSDQARALAALDRG